MTEHDDGEQGPDTDGLAKRYSGYDNDAPWLQPQYLVSDGLAVLNAAIGNETLAPLDRQILAMERAQREADATNIAELQARIARKEAANEALVGKLGATLADMRSLQRQNENWRAECQRLSALLIETRAQLAQRMAMPARALRHGGMR